MAATCDSSTSVRRALLVGCNYKGTDMLLEGCINDTESWHKLLVDIFGFSEENITILTDEHASGPKRASKDGIKDNLTSLVQSSKSGDILFFHFSGHGTQTPDISGDDYEADGQDEVILAADKVHVLDDELREIFSKLESGVKFTVVCDSCCSGTILDNAELIIDGDTREGARSGDGGTMTRGVASDESERGEVKLTPGDKLRGILPQALKTGGESNARSTATGNDRVSRTSGGAQTNLEKGMLITGARPHERAYEITWLRPYGKHGLLSYVAAETLRRQYNMNKRILTNREVVLAVNSFVVKYQRKQHVRLEGLSGKADARFILW